MKAADLRRFLEINDVSDNPSGRLMFSELNRWDWFIIVGGKLTDDVSSDFRLEDQTEAGIWMKSNDGEACRIALTSDVASSFGPLEVKTQRATGVPADIQVIRILK